MKSFFNNLLILRVSPDTGTTRSYSLGTGRPGKSPNGDRLLREELFITPSLDSRQRANFPTLGHISTAEIWPLPQQRPNPTPPDA